MYYVPIGKVRCARYPQYVPDHFGNLTNWFQAHSLLNIYLLTYLLTYLLIPEYSRNATHNFLGYFANRQTDKRWSKQYHAACGGGNKRRLQTADLLAIYFTSRMNLRDSFGLLVKQIAI